MENRYGLLRQGSGVWRSLTDGDFEEEDVWAVLKERRDSSFKVGQSIIDMETPISVQRRLPSAARMIPRINNGSSSSNSPSHERSKGVKLQSAPVKIPDWSKVSGKKSRKASKNDDDDDRFFNHGRDSYYYDDDDDDDDDYDGDGDDDDDDVYNCKVPIHEFIDSRQARSQISSFSVFEGVGRTLKGRDLSKVRNAVLTKTGFLE